MRRASIGEVQHNLSSLLGYIEQGEEILLTRRNRVIARIIPATEPGGRELPDFNERSRQMFQIKIKLNTLAKYIGLTAPSCES